MTEFVSLHNRTHFSILSALPSPKDYFLRAKELAQKAIAITDCGSLAGVWDSLKASKETGIKLIIGCEFYFVDDLADKSGKFRFVVLLAKNIIGYKNILTLNKIAFENSIIVGKRVIPIIDWKLLKDYSEGIICLTSGGNGIVGNLLNNKKFDEAENALLKLYHIFGDNFGVEVQTHNLQRPSTHYSDSIDQFFTNNHLIRLAKKHNFRIVPTTNSHYLKKEDAEVHDVLLAIGSMQPVYSNARLKYNISDLYLKSAEEVKAFFARNQTEEFAEQICENSVYFANLCEEPNWIDPKFTNPTGKELPIFPVEKEKDYDNFKNWLAKRDKYKHLDIDKAYLRFKCGIQLVKLNLSNDIRYVKRLEEELDVLYYCGVSSYMLIVADYVNWAKEHILVGPGRGSVGGSLVAFLLGIHKADPIKYGLVFERFHNKLKNSYSDIDCDFSKENRDKVLSYIIDKYGKEHYSQISNFVFITPKVYVRDISRSCDLANDRALSVKLGNDIAEIIPKTDNGREIRTYEDIVNRAPLYNEYVKRYPNLSKYSAICGKPRTAACHASGILISARPIPDIVPIRIDKDNIISVQVDKDRIEEMGLVKMDILGLETLDIIEKTNNLIKQNGKEAPIIDYDAYDEKTYNLISKGDTFCVFQFGTSGGTIDLCKKIKPKSIEDLAIITAIARPVSKNIREDFVKARENNKTAKLLHKSLENSLKGTYGFPVFDESLLVLAKDVAGWELDEADKLRKLTKEKGKNPQKAEKWRVEFIEGATKNGIDKDIAIKIWHDIVEPFGTYGFNKSIHYLQDIDVYNEGGHFLDTKPIKNIKKGDFVKSRDEQSNKTIFTKIIEKHDHGVLPLYEVELVTGEKIKCTINHKFRVEESGEMLPLWKIVMEQYSIVVNGVKPSTSSIEVKNIGNIKSITYIGEAQTYDLEVAHKDHQFYLSNGVLTSNSHAVLYSMLSYHTAFLKAHHPIEFLLANLMSEIKSNAKVADSNIEKIKQELKNNGIKIVPPDINKSSITYEIQKDGSLLTGFEALKSIGDDAIKNIIDTRPFLSFYDFMSKIDSSNVRSTTIQSLASSGCFDCFGISRKLIYLYCSDYRKKLQIWLKKHNPKTEKFEYPWPNEGEWTIPELYALEKNYLGEAFICGKSNAYPKFFSEPHVLIEEIRDMHDRETISTIRAEIKSVFEFKVKKETSRYLGQNMIKATIEDVNGEQITLTIFPNKWKETKDRMKDLCGSKYKFDAGLAIHFSGTVNIYEDEVGIVLENLFGFSPTPPLPKDLKAKKVIGKRSAKDNVDILRLNVNDTDMLIGSIEDQLFDEGLVDLSEELD